MKISYSITKALDIFLYYKQLISDVISSTALVFSLFRKFNFEFEIFKGQKLVTQHVNVPFDGRMGYSKLYKGLDAL